MSRSVGSFVLNSGRTPIFGRNDADPDMTTGGGLLQEFDGGDNLTVRAHSDESSGSSSVDIRIPRRAANETSLKRDATPSFLNIL